MVIFPSPPFISSTEYDIGEPSMLYFQTSFIIIVPDVGLSGSDKGSISIASSISLSLYSWTVSLTDTTTLKCSNIALLIPGA